MNRYFLLLIVWLAITPALAQFRYLPERPKLEEVVSFTYTPSEAMAKAGPVEAVWLRYGSPLQMRLSQPETVTTTAQENGVVMGTFKLPFKEVAGVMMAFRSKANPALVDHNNTHFYPIFLYGKSGTLLPHAVGGLGSVMMRTSFPYILKLRPDWSWVLEQYQREVQLNPTVRPLYWSDIVRAKIQQAKPGYQQVCLVEIKTYLDSQTPNPTPADLTAAAQLYDLLKEPNLAFQARERIKVVDPTSEAAQKSRSEAIVNETDTGKKRAAFNAFVQSLPRSVYRPVVVSSMAEAYFKAGGYKELTDLLGNELAPETDPMLLLSFAQQLTDEGRALPQAEWLASRAIWAFNQRIVITYTNPAGGTTDKYAQIRVAQATLAHAAEQQERFGPALTLYRHAATGLAPNQTTPLTNERTWRCAQRAARADSVLPFIESVVRVGKSTSKLRTSLQEWQATRLGGAIETANYLKGLEANYRADRRAEIAERFVDEPAPSFSLRTLDGRSVSLAALRGKVVVLDFWATWCGPCIASFPAVRQARDNFKNDPNVQFLFVNTREGGPMSRVQSFIARQPNTGPVPLDTDQRVSNAYGVQGIPTKVVIDPRGRVRFRSIGYNGNAEATADELTLVIEALKDL
jgi:thiol-disulfide isomerase/thioredoxin